MVPGRREPISQARISILPFPDNTITFNTIAKLHSLLEDDGPLPYMIDVVDYDHLENQDLKAHIDRVGQIIYESE